MKPRGITIKRQTQTESPQSGASAIMDDTGYTMDDLRVMMGGQVATSPDIRAKATTPKIQATIRRRH